MSSKLKSSYKFWKHALARTGLIVGALLLSACALVVPGSDVTIGTGGPGDASFPLGGSICRLFNLDVSQSGKRCAVAFAATSAERMKQLRDGRINVTILPSDVLADVVRDVGVFATPKSKSNLRILFTGHADAITIVVRRELGIHNAADLRGKRINMGSPGSAEQISIRRIMTQVGLARDDFTQVFELTLEEQHRALCANELDAIIYAVPHPNGLIEDVIRMCNGALVDISGPGIDNMLRQHPEYDRSVILGGTYIGSPNDVQTLGVRAVVVASTDLSDALAYSITKSVFDNFDVFRRLHPAFTMLSISDSVGTGRRSVPLHEGAARYYRERGWMD